MGRNKYAIYEDIEEQLKFIISSRVRTKMLISLTEGAKTSGIIREELGQGASTIIHAARDLEKERLLEEKEDGYHLTPIGNVIALKLIDTFKTMNVLNTHKDFWLSHDIDGIPREFLERIGELEEAEVIKSTPSNVFKTFSYYFQLVRNAKKVIGVSPILHPRFPPIIEKLVNKGTDVKLVLTDEIFEIGKEKYYHLFQELINKKNFQVWVSERPIKVAFTVTEGFISLALFNLDGSYDPNTDLVSKSKGAINWGRELFEYYKSRARKVIQGT